MIRIGIVQAKSPYKLTRMVSPALQSAVILANVEGPVKMQWFGGAGKKLKISVNSRSFKLIIRIIIIPTNAELGVSVQTPPATFQTLSLAHPAGGGFKVGSNKSGS